MGNAAGGDGAAGCVGGGLPWQLQRCLYRLPEAFCLGEPTLERDIPERILPSVRDASRSAAVWKT